MVAVEALASSAVAPGLGQRLADVASALQHRRPQIERIELLDPLADFSLAWRRVLHHLPVVDASMVEPAGRSGTMLRDLQDALCHARDGERASRLAVAWRWDAARRSCRDRSRRGAVAGDADASGPRVPCGRGAERGFAAGCRTGRGRPAAPGPGRREHAAASAAACAPGDAAALGAAGLLCAAPVSDSPAAPDPPDGAAADCRAAGRCTRASVARVGRTFWTRLPPIWVTRRTRDGRRGLLDRRTERFDPAEKAPLSALRWSVPNVWPRSSATGCWTKTLRAAPPGTLGTPKRQRCASRCRP
jgi:hypothetical protein